MPVNPYFNHTTFVTEQSLINDLIVEAIKIHGHTSYYLPREDVDIDHFLGEDNMAKYDDAYEIEVYLKSHFASGQSEFMSKFGLVIEDQMTFLVATSRFVEELGDRLARPRENDIIFIEMTPTNRYLFEIRFVEDKEQIFQLGKLYTYELRCELMNFSHERVSTTVPEVNAVAERDSYTLEINMALGGTGNYANDEMVFQGSTVLNADATGTVLGWHANNRVLSVQAIVGAFSNAAPVIGVTSNAAWTPETSPDTTPDVKDPIADNEYLQEEGPSVVQPLDNPRLQN